MHYKILYENPNESIANRLLKIRNIEDNLEDFLSPSYSRYRQDPSKLNQIEEASKRIIQAIEKQEKIMIFGDYDVDGIVSSYVMYTFFSKFLQYKNISVRLPHRTKDGYGIKSYHLDEIKSLGCSLVITVDNGITAIEEAKHALEIGVDMIVTDHHKALEQLPAALAVINPQISPDFGFQDICGAAVACKVCMYLAEKLLDKESQKELLQTLLPFVAIATVADCMPLVQENRLLVSK
ncbi:MAG: DHH family phosphoesterase [Candidatus Peribacteria bacterium]|nr:MAG: DHH family phosphoesterase [Candidatus Peribacteria bacterium]